MNRISRDSMFMSIAKIVAERGTCDRARVGAVLVDSRHKIRSIGYNGSPHGEPHCDEVGHLMHHGHCVRTIHAEENCIDSVVPDGEHYTLYVTHYPCIKCQAILYEWLRQKPGTTMLVLYENKYGELTYFERIKEVHDILQFSRLRLDQIDGTILES